MFGDTRLTSLEMVVDRETFNEVLALPLDGGLSSVDPDPSALLLDKLTNPLGHRHLGEDDVRIGRIAGHALKGDLPASELPLVEASYALLGVLNDDLGVPLGDGLVPDGDGGGRGEVRIPTGEDLVPGQANTGINHVYDMIASLFRVWHCGCPALGRRSQQTGRQRPSQGMRFAGV